MQQQFQPGEAISKFESLRQKQSQIAQMHITLLDEPIHTVDQLEAFKSSINAIVSPSNNSTINDHHQRQQKAFTKIISKLDELAAEMSDVAATAGGLKSFEDDWLSTNEESLHAELAVQMSPSPSSVLPAVLLQEIPEEKPNSGPESTLPGSRLQSPPGGLLSNPLLGGSATQSYQRISMDRFGSQGNLFAGGSSTLRPISQSGSFGNLVHTSGTSGASATKNRTGRLAKTSSSVDFVGEEVNPSLRATINSLNRERSRSRSVNDSARPLNQ